MPTIEVQATSGYEKNSMNHNVANDIDGLYYLGHQNTEDSSTNMIGSPSSTFQLVENIGTEQTMYKVYKRRWYGILSLSLLNIATFWGWLSFSAISSLSADYYNLSSQTPINWLSTVLLFSYVVISPLVWWTLSKKILDGPSLYVQFYWLWATG
jgi:hypothetical protein